MRMSISTPSGAGDQSSRLFAPVLASDEVLDHDGQIGGINRLGEVHLEAGLQSADPVVNPSIGRERYRRSVEIALSLPLAHATNQAVAVFTRHYYVDHHHIEPLSGWLCSDQIKGFGGGTGGEHVRAVLRKRRLKQFARIIFVINHQHAHTREFSRTFDRSRRASSPAGRRGNGADRQHHFESRALVFASACGLGHSAMQFDHVLDKSQVEAKATVPFRARHVGLSEAVKDKGQEIRANAFAGIAHGDADVRIYALQARFDTTSLWGELDGVGEQVPDHLLQAGGVAGDLTNFVGEIGLYRYPFSVRRRADRLNRLLNYRDQVHRPDLQPELAADDAGRVE